MLIDRVRPHLRVYGPYLRKDGRCHILLWDGKKNKTISYPKWLMEQHLGRELDPNKETIDHIDRDFNNNDLSNLRIIPRSQHAREDTKRLRWIEVRCIWCDKTFMASPHDLDGNAKKAKSGPFCSKQCSGAYGASVQNGGKILPRKYLKIKREYYLLSKK